MVNHIMIHLDMQGQSKGFEGRLEEDFCQSRMSRRYLSYSEIKMFVLSIDSDQSPHISWYGFWIN